MLCRMEAPREDVTPGPSGEGPGHDEDYLTVMPKKGSKT